MPYKAPRGTTDILPQEQPYWSFIYRKAEELCRHFGYQRIDTPAFEEAGLFVRSVGAGTDIVEKETYTFTDRSGDALTLRPEGTAPVCRAYLEHGMASWTQPVRLYYFAPIFRYERPQAGRYRQHHQFGYEALGDSDPAMDAEVIEMAWSFFGRLGLKGLVLLINSIGDGACRPVYLQRLRDYYRPLLSHLCGDCKARFERNTLRLLDCKKETCQPYVNDAPASVDSLCGPCLEHWQKLLRFLDLLGISYTVSHRLVRGLDYYTRTVFEVQPPEGGAQSTIGGGGRYDGLIQELGGRPTPGVGFAAGIERIVLNLKGQKVAVPQAGDLRMFVAYVGEPAREEAVKLASRLRSAGVTAMLASSGRSLKAQLRQADGFQATHAFILGEAELATGTVILRDLAKAEQRALPLTEALSALQQRPA